MGDLSVFYAACQTYADLLRDAYLLESSLAASSRPTDAQERLADVKTRQRQQQKVIIEMIPRAAARVRDAGGDPRSVLALEPAVKAARASFYEAWAAARSVLKPMLYTSAGQDCGPT